MSGVSAVIMFFFSWFGVLIRACLVFSFRLYLECIYRSSLYPCSGKKNWLAHHARLFIFENKNEPANETQYRIKINYKICWSSTYMKKNIYILHIKAWFPRDHFQLASTCNVSVALPLFIAKQSDRTRTRKWWAPSQPSFQNNDTNPPLS